MEGKRQEDKEETSEKGTFDEENGRQESEKERERRRSGKTISTREKERQTEKEDMFAGTMVTIAYQGSSVEKAKKKKKREAGDPHDYSALIKSMREPSLSRQQETPRHSRGAATTARACEA